ncbi:MAG: transcription elongation factor GreA [Candidatus Roizmanbacteria bacterium]|nr:transcription elongation factor GreA [Candidatus Roizmanbacteria bacterium]
MKNIQLTQDGYNNLKEELKELQTVKRPSTVDRLQKARSMGDLKENSGYQSAREELGELDGRILEVQYILSNAEIVTTATSDTVISLGKKVEVDVNGVKKSISIVGEFESDPMNGKLSTTSPIGSTLLGKKVGDKVEVTTPGGKVPYIILSIA